MVCTPGKEGTGPGVHRVVGCTGREHSPWSTFGKGYTASPRTKDPAGISKRPLIGRGQRRTQRADNLVAAFQGATPYVLHSAQAWHCSSVTKDMRQSTEKGGSLCGAGSFKI